MKITEVTKQLLNVSPRFAKGEEKAAQYIKKFLVDNKVQFVDQAFAAGVPIALKSTLTVDGEAIECRNVGMKSGKFIHKKALLSSLLWGEQDFNAPQNINFNPLCKDSISMAMFYKNPALAIKRDDIAKVIKANQILGETRVQKYSFTGHNFLVGNLKNPNSIIFTHYDCWESGAIDNASGSAVLLHMVVNEPELLAKNVFVIAGNEEISYDQPIYWGKGYREFQRKYSSIMETAKKLLLIDCVGYSEHEWVSDPDHVILGIPLDDFEKYSKKTEMISGDFEKLLKVYHSNDDSIELLSEEMLQDATSMLKKKIESTI